MEHPVSTPLADLLEHLKQSEETIAHNIRSIKEALLNNRYQIDSKSIAKKLIEHTLETA